MRRGPQNSSLSATVLDWYLYSIGTDTIQAGVLIRTNIGTD